MPSFNIDLSEGPSGLTIVKVEGFLDAHTFQEFEKVLADLFEQQKVRLVVDLSGLEYISSAGAGVFIGHIGSYQDAGGNIILMAPRENVRDVFDLLGLSQIFQFADDLDAAAPLFG